MSDLGKCNGKLFHTHGQWSCGNATTSCLAFSVAGQMTWNTAPDFTATVNIASANQ